MHGQLFNQLIVVQTGNQLISTKKAANDDVIEIIHHFFGKLMGDLTR
jgi:hypothetical protein